MPIYYVYVNVVSQCSQKKKKKKKERNPLLSVSSIIYEVQHLRLITLLVTSRDDEFKCSEVQPVQIWNKPCFNSSGPLGK